MAQSVSENMAGFKRGQTGQLPRASTTKGPPEKNSKEIITFLPPNQQRQSTEGKFLITSTLLTKGNRRDL